LTRAFGDDQLELELRAVLDEHAEDVASRARSVAEMTAELIPRLRTGGLTGRREWILRLAAVATLILLLVLGAIIFGARPSRPPLHLLLGIDLPFAGEPGAPPIVDAVRLALRDATTRPGLAVDIPAEAVFDDAAEGSGNGDKGADNVRKIAADPRYVAIIGPYHSYVAESEIPVSNEAGILQCSPSNTGPGLTRGDGAATLRPRPDRPSYVRVATPDDASTTTAARLVFGVLGKRSAFIVSTVEPWAGGRLGTFVDAFQALGGTISGTGSIGDGGDDPVVVAARIAASGAASVFFDGPAAEGAAVLSALATKGVDIPFVGLDIILDGPRSAAGSFLNIAGAAARNAYGVFPAGTDPTLGPKVNADYEEAYGRPPDNFVLSGHACARVILDAIERIDASKVTSLAEWREAIRTEVTAPGRSYRTAVGTIQFDSNGDAQPPRVSIYRADLNAGTWAFSQMLELEPGS
jgi:branched-chain amino acid transport system substrate-binding protein